MPKTADLLTDPTDRAHVSRLLDDALRLGYVGGSVLLRERYVAPWAVAIPRGEELRTVLRQAPGALPIAFHLVEYGHCEIRLDRKRHVDLTAGDVAICFGGVAHEVATGAATKAEPIQALIGAKRRPPTSARAAPASVGLLCGVFTIEHNRLNPLLAALPDIVRASTTQPGGLHNLSGAARLLVEEVDRVGPTGSYVAERLLDILCAETIRAHVHASLHGTGWFKGLCDPVVGRAMAAVHRAPEVHWSVARLAAEVSLSASRFGARFSATVGESPMIYVTRWRMNVACRRLATTDDSVERIAVAVGYDSVPAFSRTFKGVVGLPPGRFRARAKRA